MIWPLSNHVTLNKEFPVHCIVGTCTRSMPTMSLFTGSADCHRNDPKSTWTKYRPTNSVFTEKIQ